MNRLGKKSQSSNAKHLLTIKYRMMLPDGEGGFTEGWYDRVNVWGELSPITAKQKFEYASINVDATHRIKINGSLRYQNNTKFVNDTWSISYSGVTGIDVDIYYRIDYGSWVLISASETNTGSYDWIIPVGAIGKRIQVRIRDIADADSYYITDTYNIVPEGSRDGIPDEYDKIVCNDYDVTRNFEILTVENLQEINEQIVITCLEKRD